MSLDELMALVPIEAANSTLANNGVTGGSTRKSRWEKTKEKTNNAGTRWGDPNDKPYLPPPYVDLPAGLTPVQIDQFLREQRYDELSFKLATSDLEFGDPDIRPPSPPPIYDKNGSRINTREARVRTSMQSEYYRLIEYLLKTVSGFVAPPDYRPIKKIRKIEIPLDKFPDYNFMGLIIGPRGCNHKRLEAESGAQISVRGKGTQKEGKRTDHQNDEEASLPMHVHISADNEEAVEKAASLIEPLLDPFHPMHEEFKKRGLEQLALVNGIHFQQLDVVRCAVCSAVGHLAAECPDAQQLQNFKKPDVRCAICGDMGHVTMDCKFGKPGMNADIVPPGPPGTVLPLPLVPGLIRAPHILPPHHIPPPPYSATSIQQQYYDKLKMDREYNQMMNELTGESITSTTAAGNEESGETNKSCDSLDSNVNGSLSKTLSPIVPQMRPGLGMVGTNLVTPPPGVSPISQNSFYGSNNVESPLLPGTNPFTPPPPDSVIGGLSSIWTIRPPRDARSPRMPAQWRQPHQTVPHMVDFCAEVVPPPNFAPAGRGMWINSMCPRVGITQVQSADRTTPWVTVGNGRGNIWMNSVRREQQPAPPSDNAQSVGSSTNATADVTGATVDSVGVAGIMGLSGPTILMNPQLFSETDRANHVGWMGNGLNGMQNQLIGLTGVANSIPLVPQISGAMLNMPSIFPVANNALNVSTSFLPEANALTQAPPDGTIPLPPVKGLESALPQIPLDPSQLAQAQLAAWQMSMLGNPVDPTILGIQALTSGIGITNSSSNIMQFPQQSLNGLLAATSFNKTPDAPPPEPPKDDTMDTSV